MFKLAYNIFALVIILIQLVTVGLIYAKYSLSAFSDALMMAMSVATALQLIEIMLIDQFMYIYHEAKSKSLLESHKLYHFGLFVCLCVGVAVYIAALIGWTAMPVYFGFGLTGERLAIYLSLMKVMSFGFLFYPFVAINDRLFNAEGFYGISYLLTSVIHITFFVGMLIITLTHNADFAVIGYCYFIGNLLGAAISQVIISKYMKFGFKFRLHSAYGRKLIVSSFMMRIGHNIYAILFYPITNVFLVQLPTGYVSVFYYAQRAVLAIFSVSTGPSLKMYMTKVSTLFVRKQFAKIRYFSAKYIGIVSILYAACGIIGFLFIYLFLDRFTSMMHISIGKEYFNSLLTLYVLILAWQYVVIFETKYIAILLVRNLTREFITTNSIFIVIYTVMAYSMVNRIGIYAIAVSALAAQLVNLLFYRHYADFKSLKHDEPEVESHAL